MIRVELFYGFGYLMALGMALCADHVKQCPARYAASKMHLLIQMESRILLPLAPPLHIRRKHSLRRVCT